MAIIKIDNAAKIDLILLAMGELDDQLAAEAILNLPNGTYDVDLDEVHAAFAEAPDVEDHSAIFVAAELLIFRGDLMIN